MVVVSEHAKSAGKSDATTGSAPTDHITIGNIPASQEFILKPIVVAVAMCLGALSSQNVMAEMVIDCGPALVSGETSGAVAGGSGAFTYLTGKVACYSNIKGASLTSDDANDSMAVTIYTDSLKVGSGGIDSKGSVNEAAASKEISFNNNKLTNIVAGTAATDATNLKQVQDLIAAGGGGASVANDNYAQVANSTALGAATGSPHNIELDANNKIVSVGGIAVTATGATLDTITKINSENVTPAQVAQFKKAAEKGGNIALTGVALGNGNITSSVNGGVALGSGNKVYANYGATAIGSGNTTSGSFSSALGVENTASNERSNAVGFNNKASGRDSAALGSGNTASGMSSTAMGSYNTASANQSSVFGSESTAAFENSTAIGYQSETDRTNSISVGKAGAEKQITFVKAGTVATDAVNFAQLNSLVSVLGGNFSNGSYTAPTYVIQGSNYNNVGSAFTAVNTKLTSLQSQIEGLPSGGTGGGTSGKSAYQIATDNGFSGTEAEWLTSLKGNKGDTGLTGAAGAQGSKGDKGDTGLTGAVGAQGSKGDKGDTGLTGAAGAQGSKGDKGDTGLTGAAGAQGSKGDKGDTGLTGAAGAQGSKGDKGDTGLTGAAGAQGSKGDKGDVGATGAKGDTGATGKSAYEIAKQNGFTGTETEWANSASNSYIQIQSNTPKLGPKATATGTDAIAIGTDALAQGEQSISIGVGNQVKGNNSGAIGDPSYINADDSYAIGNNNTINGDGKTFVVGNNVNTSAKNAVVLGNDSASDRDNTVSVGAAGKERQIINVTAGVQDTDAVNVKQMKDANTKTLTDAKIYVDAGDQATLTSAKGYTDSREVVMHQESKTADAKVLSDSKAYTDTKVVDLENNFRDVSNRVDQTNQDVRKNRDIAAQGIAGITAMTNIPMPAEQGASTVGLGMGYYDSQSAIAVGASHYFDNGVAIKGAFSTGFNNGNTTAVGGGVSYSWK